VCSHVSDPALVAAGSLIQSTITSNYDRPGSVRATRSVTLRCGSWGSVQLSQERPLEPLVLDWNLSSVRAGCVVTVGFREADGRPVNQSGRPLNVEERPGCTGAIMVADASGVCHGQTTNYAFTLYGKLSLLGKTSVLLFDDVQVAEMAL
jgi:hypothetical protein